MEAMEDISGALFDYAHPAGRKEIGRRRIVFLDPYVLVDYENQRRKRIEDRLDEACFFSFIHDHPILMPGIGQLHTRRQPDSIKALQINFTPNHSNITEKSTSLQEKSVSSLPRSAENGKPLVSPADSR
jgi:hypothetical protein